MWLEQTETDSRQAPVLTELTRHQGKIEICACDSVHLFMISGSQLLHYKRILAGATVASFP